MSLFAAVLAGGSGTRFWPASTRQVPKQFLPLTGGAPLLRETIARLDGLVPAERILVVTSRALVGPSRKVLPEVPEENFLGEPRARNTAAACALAAHEVLRRDPGATLVTLPSDHVVEPAADLRTALAAAASRADAQGCLVTLGLEPTHPATGFGWIRVGDPTSTAGDRTFHRVDRFVEKPSRGDAEVFLAQGGHLWNLGMFAWRPGAFLDQVALHLPQVADPLRAAAPALGTAGQDAALDAAYEAVLPISVDHGVLERSDAVECLPCSFAWDDLGSFAALARHLEGSADGIVSVGDLAALDSRDCTTWAQPGRLVALLGVHDLIVVHANGATLVAARSRAEDVRRLVDGLAERDLDRFS